jgi:hypothetical protein
MSVAHPESLRGCVFIHSAIRLRGHYSTASARRRQSQHYSKFTHCQKSPEDIFLAFIVSRGIDQFPGGVKTFDASISPTITTDGKWNHVSFTLDQLTPSGSPGSATYDPTQGFVMSFDSGIGPWDQTIGDAGQIVLDNLLLVLKTPTLNITPSGSSLIVSWPNVAGYVLQQSSSLGATAVWTTNGGSISTSGGMNSITITPPITGNLFFCLYLPPENSPAGMAP